MSLRSYLKKTISDFRGAWTVRDQTRQTAQRASIAQNVRFFPGKVFTRPGTSLALSLGSGAIRSMYSWLVNYLGITPFYRLLYLMEPNLINLYAQNSSVNDALYTRSGVTGLSVVEAETRVYIGHYGSDGLHVGGLKIVSTELSGQPADDGFPDPSAVVPVMTDDGPGLVTAGPHRFGYRIESRTGFPGRMSPEVAGVFTPATITVAPGGRKIRFSATFALTPPDSAVIQLCMTTTDNLEQYFDIPDASDALPPNAVGWLVTRDISITDEDLVAILATADVTPNFSFMTQSHGAPAPSKVVKMGNRNVYIQNATLYISDPYNLQVLQSPDNTVQVDGQKFIVTAETLGTASGQLVIFTTNNTFVLGGDNSRKPRQWAPPYSVSDSIGTAAVNGVCKTAGYAALWVMHDSGLYIFNGAYGEIPISFMFQADWKRINWTQAAKIQMVDDANARCLKILVPLDGATDPNYMMVIDYSRARTGGTVDPMAVDYSLDDLSNATATPSIAMVQNYTSKLREFWIGLSNGKVIREDSTVKSDKADGSTAVPIHALYETGLVLAISQAKNLLSRFGGVQLDVKGQGNLTISPYGLGRQTTPDDPVDPVQLQDSPDGMEEARWHMVSENQTIRFETGTPSDLAGDYFELQEIAAFYKAGGTTKAA